MRVVLEERKSLSIESVIVLLVVVSTTLVDASSSSSSSLHAASFSHDDELSFSSSFDSASSASSAFKFDDLTNTADHLSQPVLGKYTELKFDAPAEEQPSSSKSGKTCI